MIIFLTGYKGAGKDATGYFLGKAFRAKGWHTIQLAFADELRQHMEILNPIVGTQCVETETGYDITLSLTWREAVEINGYDRAKERYPEMRRLMQRYGTQIIRDRVGSNYWVEAIQRKIETYEESLPQKDDRWVVILTDCRFANEYYRLRVTSNSHRLLEVRRKGHESDGHESEDLGWLKGLVHAWMPNHGTLQDLKNVVDLWVADVCG